MAAGRLASLAALAKATLRDPVAGTDVLGSTLWQSQPVAVLILRRPGCVLCRDEAAELWKLKPQLDDLGVGLVCVVHEWRQAELDAFKKGFWPGPVYHDIDKVFYKELNGGERVLRGSLLELMWPWSKPWARIRDASSRVKEHNLVGDGLTMGGTMIIGKGDSGVLWQHLERGIGDIAQPLVVLGHAQQVAGKASAAST